MKKILFFVFVLFFCCEYSYAGTYYVDSNGSASWANCEESGGTPGVKDGVSACSLSTANANVSAGDIVYLRGSTNSASYEVYSLTSDGIAPTNSGTGNGARITFSVYPGEYVELSGDADSSGYHSGIALTYKDYVTVTGHHEKGLKISKFYRGFLIGSANSPAIDWSDSNEISYCWIGFNSDPSWIISYNHSMARFGARYSWIHNNVFEEVGTLEGSASGGALTVGEAETPGTPSVYTYAYYNIVENNEFLKTGHHSLRPVGKYNLYRNNYSHNEAWYLYNGEDRSYRGWEAAADGDYSGNNVMEGNRLGHIELDYSGSANSTLKWSLANCIFRYNALFNTTYNPLYITNQYTAVTGNIFYNNTIAFSDGSYTAIGVTSTPTNNVFKNNLHWDTYGTRNGSIDYFCYSGCTTETLQANNDFDSNYNDIIGEASATNPLFEDNTITSYNSWILPDLNLQDGSPAIDGGTHLTIAVGSGSGSTILTVDDSRYFSDGEFGSGSGIDTALWPTGVDFQADWICVGSTSNCSQIDSVNYGTDVITLVSSLSWADSDEVWLYKDTDGDVVLVGSAPDYGAYENGSGGGWSNTYQAETMTGTFNSIGFLGKYTGNGVAIVK